MLLEYIIISTIAYLLGSINSAIIVGKLYGIDIRQHGSGNAGATNTLRTLGKKAAVLVILGDILKGVVAALIGLQIGEGAGMLIGGLFSILGHNWPVYFNFKGGKGILTSAAVILTIDWRIGLALLVIGIAIIAITRYVSLGSIIGCLLLPIVTWLLPSYRQIPKTEFILFSIIVGLLAIIRHHENIKRLLQGTESKIGQKSKVK